MSNLAMMMGLGASPAPLKITDAFSTTLYTGTGAALTIANNIDVSTEGGLVWLKNRTGSDSHALFDTETGVRNLLRSNTTDAATLLSSTQGVTAFNSNGFTIGSTDVLGLNNTSKNVVSWVWRKAPKFFDIVKYTGTGAARTISHALNSEVGMILIKKTSGGGTDWQVFHRTSGSTPQSTVLYLNETAAAATNNSRFNNTLPTSSEFSLSGDGAVNGSGGTYIAYLFAHNEDLIQCGSYVGNGSSTGTVVDLGFEPQWLLIKKSTGGAQDWALYDNKRGLVSNGDDARLSPNTSGDELNGYQSLSPTSTGFQLNSSHDWVNTNNETYVYMAIKKA